MKLKDIVGSWDFLGALLVSILVGHFIPDRIDNGFARDLYNIGISVLSIVFSVYFAALAIIMSASDNDFALFLEEEGDYSAIVKTFKFSLTILFVALLYAIFAYGMSLAWIAAKVTDQSMWWFIPYAFLFLYGLLTVACATQDAIKYSEFRIRYLKAQKAAPKKSMSPIGQLLRFCLRLLGDAAE